jgi:hypothetical protein
VKQPPFTCKGAKVVVAWGEDALGNLPPTYQNPDDPDANLLT